MIFCRTMGMHPVCSRSRTPSVQPLNHAAAVGNIFLFIPGIARFFYCIFFLYRPKKRNLFLVYQCFFYVGKQWTICLEFDKLKTNI